MLNEPNSFRSAIFHQIVPMMNESPSLYLTGESRRMSYAQDFVSVVHLLSNVDALKNSSSVLVPKLTSNRISRIKKYEGSLIFFGRFVFIIV